MKAKFTKPNQHNAKSMDKELINSMTLVARLNGELHTVVRTQLFMGRSNSASVVYCNLWVLRSDQNTTSGYGTAGGYGYHKQSQALEDAITSAGITLYGSPYDASGKTEEGKEETEAHIGGCGDGAMRSALLAIAVAAGADVTEYLIV